MGVGVGAGSGAGAGAGSDVVAGDATGQTPAVSVDTFSLPPSAAAFAAARAARSAFVGRPRFFLGFASAVASAGADAAEPASGATFSSLLIYLFPSSF